MDSLKLAIDDVLMDSKDENDVTLRGYAYEAIGLLAKACPKEIALEPSLSLLSWLVGRLAVEQPGKSAASSIEEALTSILGAFTGSLAPEVEHALAAFLLRLIEPTKMTDSNVRSKISKSARFAFVRFANRCLPYSNVTARWIDIVATSDSPENTYEIVEEGKKGLDPYWYQMSNAFNQAAQQSPGAQASTTKFEFPEFPDLVFSFFPQVQSVSLDQLASGNVLEGAYSHGPAALSVALKFCRNMFFSHALKVRGVSLHIDVDWERHLTTTLVSDQTSRRNVRAHIKAISADPESRDCLAFRCFLKVLFTAFVSGKGADVANDAESFVQLVGLSSDEILVELAPACGLLKEAVFSNRHEVRALAAHAYGLLASYEPAAAADVNALPDLLLKKVEAWPNALGAAANEVDGAAKALACLLSRLSLRGMRSEGSKAVQDKLLAMVFSMLNASTDSALKQTSIFVIAELSTFYALDAETISSYKSYKSVVDSIWEIARAGNDKAVQALGRIGMIAKEEDDNEQSDVAYVTEKLYELHEIRQVEAQFSVGESLTCLAVGWDSTVLESALDVGDEAPTGPQRLKTLEKVLVRTLKDSEKTKPSLRKVRAHFLLKAWIRLAGHASMDSVKLLQR